MKKLSRLARVSCIVLCVFMAWSSVVQAEPVQKAEPLGANKYSIYVSDASPQDYAVLDQYFQQTAIEACRGSDRVIILEQTFTSNQMIGVVECQSGPAKKPTAPKKPLPEQSIQQEDAAKSAPRQTFIPKSAPKQEEEPVVNVSGSTIGAGTISISTSTNIQYYFQTASDDVLTQNGFNLGIEGGYFFGDNLETQVGILVQWTKSKIKALSVEGETSSYGANLAEIYHRPISDNFNLYIGGVVGYLRSDMGTLKINQWTLGAEVGGEWFFTPNVALTIGARYNRYIGSGDTDVSLNQFTLPLIGLKVFTTRPVAGE